jgi:hypothetical protein
MTMNRTLRNLLAGAVTGLVLVLPACTDPSTAPASTVSGENIFKDERSYLAFLAKIYAGMATTGQQGPAGDKDIQTISDEGFSQYLRLYWEHQELPSDEAVLAWRDGPVEEFNGQNWSSSNSFLGAMFARIYLQVGWANEFLAETSDGKLSERGVGAALRTKITQYRAEARFLRALAMSHGIDLFGPIPIVTVNDPAPPPQATRQQVFDFIVTELTEATVDLPAAAGAATYGRATKEAAAMLLARMYLNAEVYTGAARYADVITSLAPVLAGPFTLDPVYRHLFEADNNTSPEIIFPIVEDGMHTQSYGGTNFLIHASCGGSMAYADYGVDGCWAGLRLKPDAYDLVNGDPRHSYLYTAGQSVAIPDLWTFTNGIAAPKFINKRRDGSNGSNSQFSDVDFPLLRLGDAYLMYAEAAVRTNTNLTEALGYVNELRERAYGDASGNITAPDLTLDFIIDERARELLWEAQRRTDLVRFGLFTGSTYIWGWKGNVEAGQSTPDRLNLYPIPASQLSANPNLTQNPGY